MTTTERPHLSHSQLEMLGRCEMQWYFRYVLGIKVPPGVAAVIGKGTHGGVEGNLRRKMDWGTPMEGDEVKDTAADAFRRAWDKGRPVLSDRDLDEGQALDMAVSLAELHAREVAPQIEPIAIEQAFLIEIPQLPFDVMGVVDVETPTHVRDTKTKGKKPAKDAAARSLQLGLYHLRATLAGTPEKGVVFDYLIKTRERQYLPIEAHPTPDDHVGLMKRFELASASITSGIFKPANPQDWACSERFCGYWERCEFGSRKAVSVGLIDPTRLSTRVIPRPHEDTAPDESVDEGA